MAAAKHAKNILITLQSCEIMTRCHVPGFLAPRIWLFQATYPAFLDLSQYQSPGV